MIHRKGRRSARRVAAAVLAIAGTLTGSLSVNAQSQSSSAPSEAFTNARAEYDRAWTESGLAFTAYTFTQAPSTGYGDYTPLEEATIADGDSLSVYAEPVGYAFSNSDGEYAYKLTVSYKLLNMSGQVLAAQENFAQFEDTGRSKQHELSAALTFQFSGLPAGSYQLEAVFQDEVGNQSASFTLPFTATAQN